MRDHPTSRFHRVRPGRCYMCRTELPHPRASCLACSVTFSHLPVLEQHLKFVHPGLGVFERSRLMDRARSEVRRWPQQVADAELLRFFRN